MSARRRRYLRAVVQLGIGRCPWCGHPRTLGKSTCRRHADVEKLVRG